MSYHIEYVPQWDLVHLCVEGGFNMARLREIAPQVAELCEAHRCQRILNDMRRAEIDVSVMDVYNSPQSMDEANISRRTQRALVVPPGFDKGAFLETVTRNRGHNLRVFTDIELAREWLLQGAGAGEESLHEGSAGHKPGGESVAAPPAAVTPRVE